MTKRRLYLRPGDLVIHCRYPQWGIGEVLEVCTSRLPGGFSYVRILFQDGRKRIFDNDFESHNCCYHSGIRLAPISDYHR